MCTFWKRLALDKVEGRTETLDGNGVKDLLMPQASPLRFQHVSCASTYLGIPDRSPILGKVLV